MTQTDKINKKKQLLSTFIVIVWVIATVFAFWWFQFRYLGSYENHWVSYQGEHLVLDTKLNDLERPLVVHFVDPECPCSRFARPHIADLESQFSSLIHFSDGMEHLSFVSDEVARTFEVPVSPSVAIWSASGDLAYLGPYSSGAVCGEGTDFVASVLASLADGHNPQWLNHEAVGCFCPWQINKKRGSQV
ncbi:MAG: DUF6436 domain-containing protein [Candidatus Pelagadaptatus aseana]